MEAALISLAVTAFLASAAANWRLGNIVGAFRSEIAALNVDVQASKNDHRVIYSRLDSQGNRITALEVLSAPRRSLG